MCVCVCLLGVFSVQKRDKAGQESVNASLSITSREQ